MPIENELKYILDLSKADEIRKRAKKQKKSKTLKLWQGYLTSHARIRHIEEGEKEKFVFTYKIKVSGQTVEIETEISTHDFVKLVEAVDEKIVKERISIKCNNETWEIDFLKDPKSGEVYLIMAEVEIPEWQFEPTCLPEFVQDYLVYVVEKNDKRFNNKQLGNPSAVKALYESICKTK